MRLKGKKALITGASGIGRGIAEVFAEEGADVAVNYIESAAPAEDVVKAIQALGRKAVAIKGDVAKRADVEAMIDKAWKELGGLDILINNAGIETIVRLARSPTNNGRAWWTSTSADPGSARRYSAGRRSPKNAAAASCTSDRSKRRNLLPGRQLRADEARPRSAHTQHVGRGDAPGHQDKLRSSRTDRYRHDRVGDEKP